MKRGEQFAYDKDPFRLSHPFTCPRRVNDSGRIAFARFERLRVDRLRVGLEWNKLNGSGREPLQRASLSQTARYAQGLVCDLLCKSILRICRTSLDGAGMAYDPESWVAFAERPTARHAGRSSARLSPWSGCEVATAKVGLPSLRRGMAVSSATSLNNHWEWGPVHRGLPGI